MRKYQIIHHDGEKYNVRYSDGEKSWIGNEKWYFALESFGWEWDRGTYSEEDAEKWIADNIEKRRIHEENAAKYDEPRDVPPFLVYDPKMKCPMKPRKPSPLKFSKATKPPLDTGI